MAPRKAEHELPVKYDMILAIRRIRSGPFAGLFQAVELDVTGTVKRVITDANSKGVALDLMCNAAYRV